MPLTLLDLDFSTLLDFDYDFIFYCFIVDEDDAIFVVDFNFLNRLNTMINLNVNSNTIHI